VLIQCGALLVSVNMKLAYALQSLINLEPGWRYASWYLQHVFALLVLLYNKLPGSDSTQAHRLPGVQAYYGKNLPAASFAKLRH
jgi:hypothetical protein